MGSARHGNVAVMSKTVDVDVVVVGLGPGGEHVAIKLGRAGLDVVGVENRLVGGECPYYGCVPSKMMIAAARVVADVERVPDFAGTAQVQPDWAQVARRIREEATDDWNDAVAVERLEDNGARFVRGPRRRLDGPGRVVVGDTTYVARKGVVLNTGTRPGAPPIDGLAGTPFWTNRDAVALTELPGSVVVLGGGPIGCEFAQVFSRFGVQVMLVEVAERLLVDDEPEAAELLEKTLSEHGVQVLTGVEVDQGDVRRRRLRPRPRRPADGRSSSRRRQAAGRGGATAQPPGSGPGDGRPRPGRDGGGDRRADARRRAAVRDRRHHRQGRVHPRVDVSGRDRGPRRARGGRAVG